MASTATEDINASAAAIETHGFRLVMETEGKRGRK